MGPPVLKASERLGWNSNSVCLVCSDIGLGMLDRPFQYHPLGEAAARTVDVAIRMEVTVTVSRIIFVVFAAG